jgi:chemotaxis protein CheD
VKLFGGGSIIDADHAGVGQQNIRTAEMLLKKQGVKPVRRDVGGAVGRKLFFHTHTGDVYIKRFGRRLLQKASARE